MISSCIYAFAVVLALAQNRVLAISFNSAVSKSAVNTSLHLRTDAVSVAMRQAGTSWIGDVGLASACTLPDSLRLSNKSGMEAHDYYVQGKPFTFLHWGDGEWKCAMHHAGFFPTNSDGVNLDDEGMCDMLQENLLDYGKGGVNDSNLFVMAGTFFLCQEARRTLFDTIEEFLSSHALQDNWDGFRGDGFYFPLVPRPEDVKPGAPLPLLQGRHVVLVGPKHLQQLTAMLGYTDYIEVPHVTCFASRGDIYKQISEAATSHADKNVVFLCAGGPAMKSIIFDAYAQFGKQHTFIDIGSTLDGFAGVASRDYNSDIKGYCRDYPSYVPSNIC